MKIFTDEDPSLRIESSAIINLCGVSTKLHFNLIFTMKTYKELKQKYVAAFQSTQLTLHFTISGIY